MIYIAKFIFSRNIFADEKMGIVDIFSNAYVKNMMLTKQQRCG